MERYPKYRTDSRWITAQRGPKNTVDPYRPYAFFIEKESTGQKKAEEVATLFLTNSECPFKCLMCDLWKNTTDQPVPPGAIPAQIEYALSSMPNAKHIKLYNSGSFFDPRAIPLQDHERIAKLLDAFETVTVESHPAFIGEHTVAFSKMIKGDLTVAMGLETVHPEILPLLNKKMTLEAFDEKVTFLISNNIDVRAFILLRPPFMTEEEGIEWARRSLDHAFNTGVRSCVIIPVRPGNGAIDRLEQEGFFSPPSIESLIKLMEYGLSLKKGLVFADMWDIDRFIPENLPAEPVKNRLNHMNLYQEIPTETEYLQTT
jgi:radical SAM enzyme (TIGR01210 family)